MSTDYACTSHLMARSSIKRKWLGYRGITGQVKEHILQLNVFTSNHHYKPPGYVWPVIKDMHCASPEMIKYEYHMVVGYGEYLIYENDQKSV